MDSKDHGIKVAIEIFDIKCKQLSKTRNPNIFVENQKELFSDWFENGIPYPITHLGPNDHPDAIIQGVGFELKSKKDHGQIQFNSTIPTGRFNHKGHSGECYYAIARYQKDRQFGQLVDFAICYGDYFNHDHEWAHSHKNIQENEFGNFGDGVLRHRKMYTFPSPTKHVPGVSIILDTENASQVNSNLILERKITRIDKKTKKAFDFFVYRHKLLV